MPVDNCVPSLFLQCQWRVRRTIIERVLLKHFLSSEEINSVADYITDHTPTWISSRLLQHPNDKGNDNLLFDERYAHLNRWLYHNAVRIAPLLGMTSITLMNYSEGFNNTNRYNLITRYYNICESFHNIVALGSRVTKLTLNNFLKDTMKIISRYCVNIEELNLTDAAMGFSCKDIIDLCGYNSESIQSFADVKPILGQSTAQCIKLKILSVVIDIEDGSSVDTILPLLMRTFPLLETATTYPETYLNLALREIYGSELEYCDTWDTYKLKQASVFYSDDDQLPDMDYWLVPPVCPNIEHLIVHLPIPIRTSGYFLRNLLNMPALYSLHLLNYEEESLWSCLAAVGGRIHYLKLNDGNQHHTGEMFRRILELCPHLKVFL